MKSLSQFKRMWAIITLFVMNSVAFAGSNYIPTSDDQQTDQSTSFTSTIMNVFANDIVPVIELIGSVILIYLAIRTMVSTIQEYRDKKEMGVIFEGIIILAILFGIGAAVFYLFTYITV